MHSDKHTNGGGLMNFYLRDKKISEKIILDLKKLNQKFQIMHVCGTHQDTLVRFGLNHLFEQCNIKILQGPGCPICVTTPREIEECLLLATLRETKLQSSYSSFPRHLPHNLELFSH